MDGLRLLGSKIGLGAKDSTLLLASLHPCITVWRTEGRPLRISLSARIVKIWGFSHLSLKIKNGDSTMNVYAVIPIDFPVIQFNRSAP
ncbi:hypothetical protein NDA03_11390 [Trichocoleus sp. Lan]|uniref:hypothetical protein n=1 Tax=Trichocoleus sp. Lan TaxID=2933927 RepID=UPI003297886D